MRAISVMAMLLLALLLPAATLAAGPTHSRVSFNEPADDVSESEAISEFCGFPIDADIAGFIRVTDHSSKTNGTVHKASYHIRIHYRNPANGAAYYMRDIGPDREYIKDGVLHVAVTGRSEAGTGRTGVTKINLETGEIVHQSGRELGFVYDHLCDSLS